MERVIRKNCKSSQNNIDFDCLKVVIKALKVGKQFVNFVKRNKFFKIESIEKGTHL